MKKLHLAILGALLVTTSGYAGQSGIGVRIEGETTVAAKADKWAVEVKIKTHEVQIGKPSNPRPATIESNCTYSKNPCSIVDSIEISVNGNPLFVPRSVFADLADVAIAKIDLRDGTAILELDGGDASESYIVKIEFNTTRITRRTLSSGTEPNQPLQETTYNDVAVGD